MLSLGYAILLVHFLLLSILCLFGLHRLSMVFRWLRYRSRDIEPPQRFDQYPCLTIQVPLFNERFVAERIVRAVAATDYPRNKLQIQIVDDSTDATVDLVRDLVAAYASEGLNIQHVRRRDREGFKAGALKDAMAEATGEFIAIFDADFLPDPSLLREAVHHFTDDRVAMVQFRWEHLNRHVSRLTESQGVMLDAHFALEQQVRDRSGALFNFNGTAGIWRTRAIEDAGHWSADTLTEDLDLSYRAQLKGWQLVYLNEQSCPGELPGDINAFKSQQHRWAKGGIQVMRKLLGTVWRSPLPLGVKLESTYHLSNNLAYLIMLIDSVFFLVPSLLVRERIGLPSILWLDFPLLLLSSGGHLVYFFFGQVALGRSKWAALLALPRMLLLGIQLAFNNARAAAEALLGDQGEFVRTPKVGRVDGDEPKVAMHRSGAGAALGRGALYAAISPRGGQFEFLLAFIYAIVFAWGVRNEQWLMLPFLLLLVLGFFTTALGTLRQQYAPRPG